jgi:hypothetical protein
MEDLETALPTMEMAMLASLTLASFGSWKWINEGLETPNPVYVVMTVVRI